MGWTTGVKLPVGSMIEIFLFPATSRSPLETTEPHIKRVLAIKRPGSEADHTLPSSVLVKNAW